MKFRKLILFFFMPFSAFCQNEISGNIFLEDSVSEYKNLIILLKQKDSIITGCYVDSLGNYKLTKKVPNGNYQLIVNYLGLKEMNLKIINLESDLNYDFNYPERCIYSKIKPGNCEKGENHNIIPIVYGLPSKQSVIKAKKEKIYLGGCVISECDSYFYCTIHEKKI
jgi:hypothetical protein